MSLMEEIQSEFADLDLEITDDAVLAELSVLCKRYKIDATKISCEYFSFTANTKQTANSNPLAGQPPTTESLVPFENEKLRRLKPAGSRRPLDPIEGASNLPDCPELCPEAGTPTRLLNKRQATPDDHLKKRLVTALGTPGVTAVKHSSILSKSLSPANSPRERTGVRLCWSTRWISLETGTRPPKPSSSSPWTDWINPTSSCTRDCVTVPQCWTRRSARWGRGWCRVWAGRPRDWWTPRSQSLSLGW